MLQVCRSGDGAGQRNEGRGQWQRRLDVGPNGTLACRMPAVRAWRHAGHAQGRAGYLPRQTKTDQNIPLEPLAGLAYAGALLAKGMTPPWWGWSGPKRRHRRALFTRRAGISADTCVFCPS